ncbi:rho guanine nucleotide exchange factor 40-like [Solea senegalensis]|uniref:Rho guanine nucleotide exchange factor 40-like n=1 Tax=Solea senegalensis TaxID=28829 RepID=A0AAV6Q0M7_SOLSE|nr:rho guanine nucleotide exchange factor 40-like [Solea senegalensis]
MDSESVDRCIQKVLSSLYPPFQATSATVLCQVLSVVDCCYRGDGIRCLLDFLLPAKFLLEALQQHRVQSCDEGWPLCMQEKLVVHLCPVDQRLLLPGDFYLLVSPPLGAHSASCRSSVSSSPCLLLCSMSEGCGHVEQQEVAEVALHSLFSVAWLDSVNREREQRGVSTLRCCVLAANRHIFRVPWEDVVYPQLLSCSQSHASTMDQKESHDENKDVHSWRREDVKPHLSTKANQSEMSSESEDLEGEYVELMELTELTQLKELKELTELKKLTLPSFSPQRGSSTQELSQQLRARSSTHTHTPDNPHTTNTHPSRLCEVMEEMITQDSCIRTSSSSFAPPEVTGTSSQEQTSGTEVVALREEEGGLNKEEEHVSGDEVVEREEEEVKSEEEGQLSQERKKKQVMKGKEDEEERTKCINTAEHSYCENTIKPTKDSFYENTVKHTQDSYCENTIKPTLDSYCEKLLPPPLLELEESIRAVSVSSSQLKTEVCVEEQKELSCKEKEEKKAHSCEEEEEQKEHSCEEKEEKKAHSSVKKSEQKHSCEEEEEQKEHSCEEKEEKKAHSCEEEEEQKEHSCEEEEEQKEHSCEEEEEQKEHSCEEERRRRHSCEEEEEQKEHSCEEEEEQKEHSCEEEEEQKKQSSDKLVGEGGADLQTEGLTTVSSGDQSHLRVFNSPTQQQQLLHQSAAASVSKSLSQLSQCLQSSQSSFYGVLLSSGALCLPGTTDRNGRPLVTVNTWSSVWSNSECEGAELLRLLLYYSSTLREEVRALGLTVLVDARRAAPGPALYSALMSLQDQTPGSVHTVLLLVNRDNSCVRVDKPTISQLQVQVLTSLKSLHRQVALQQLPTELGGSFSFSQSSWLCFRSRVEQLTRQCDDVINLLQKTINILETTPPPASAQEAELLLSRFKEVMRGVLEDSRLVRLQQKGGASLSWLHREVRDAWQVEVEAVSSLYNQVDELLHHLVTLSNTRTQQLSFILDFRGLEDRFTEVSMWLQGAEPRLKSLSQTEDSLQLVINKQQQFKEFSTIAYEYCKRGEELLTHLERWEGVSSADLHAYKVKVHSLWAQLQDFSQRVNDTGQNIERAVQLYTFLDQVYGWAFAGLRHLAGISMDECSLPDTCQAVIGSLQDYQSLHPPITDARFQEMRVEAEELRGELGVRQWSFASSKFQETKKMFDRKMEAALRTRDSTQRRCSDPAPRTSSTSSRKKISSGLWGIRDSSSSSYPLEVDTNTSPPSCSSLLLPLTSPFSTPQHTQLLPQLESSPSFSSSRRQQLRKTQSFDGPPPETPRYDPCSRALSEPLRRGNTGVFIRGLEVSGTEAADLTLCPRMATHSWAAPVGHGTPTADPRPKGSKLRHMVEEMVTTEREYVRSLRYIIHHYFPEMERVDLPQDLRGKRSVVFGNLEKLLDFHSQFFLRELESCWRHPLRVSHCFLRHQQQFALYALYSKNKPKSDALLLNHGNFFRWKQLQLGDKMDLLSYLLKPIQRMSKYALLLDDIIKEVGVTQEAELNALQAATNLVKFQLRHGNDLLAMDAIRDCDVNLKEQGQLIRQDEFTVWSGRRKCQRHVFLFEELVLFSKHKKMEGGLDVFIYKHSFKSADVGLTESSGDSGLRFEIWFRRRTSKNQTFILQSTSLDIKHAWTSDITRILWTQATRNKEMRMKEMVSMGVGSKPFLDIQPSDAAISDRAVDYIMKSRGDVIVFRATHKLTHTHSVMMMMMICPGARTRASIAVSVLDVNTFKRGLVTSDPRSTGPSSSSSSLLGSLNLHMFSQSLSSAADSSFITSCVEEDEQELETSSQPSMTTESSGSSSRCLSGSTGSDSSCVSSHLQEEPCPLHLRSPSSPFNRDHMIISAETAVVISPSSVL